MLTPESRLGRGSGWRSRSQPRATRALPAVGTPAAFPDGPLAAALPGAFGWPVADRQPPQSSGVEEALYALVLRRGSRRFLYIGSQRDPALRGGQSWEEYVDAVREGRGGAVTVRNRVRNGWTLESVLRGYGEETAVTFWARTALSGFPEWEVTGGLYALRPTPRNMAAMQVWEWQRLRLCTICGEPWHGAVHHDHEPGEAGELSETCGEVGTLQRELAASRGELDACRRTLEGLRGELARAV